MDYPINGTKRSHISFSVYVCFQYRAWARPESINQTRVALKAGTTIIDYYEDYFGIDFPLPKQGYN